MKLFELLSCNEVAINCKTKEEAAKLLTILELLGYRWFGSRSLPTSGLKFWEQYGKKWCCLLQRNTHTITYSNIDACKHNKVVSFTDIELSVDISTDIPIDLSNCPFCGDTANVYSSNDAEGQSFYIECSCGIRTAYYKSKAEAIQCWNTRTD